MSQAGPFMRAIQGGFAHWCAACNQMHPLPNSWKFDGNLESPSFNPSFNQSPSGPRKCHYNVVKGRIYWFGDSWHKRTGDEPMTALDTVGLSDQPLLWGEE